MAMTVACPTCGQRFGVPPHLYGTRAKCASCHGEIDIPHPDEASDQGSAPSAAARSLAIKCTSCGKKYRVPEHMFGKRVKCTSCQAVLNIPDPSQPTTPAALGSRPFPEVPTSGNPKRAHKLHAASRAGPAAVWLERKLVVTTCSVVGGVLLILLGAVIITKMRGSTSKSDLTASGIPGDPAIAIGKLPRILLVYRCSGDSDSHSFTMEKSNWIRQELDKKARATPLVGATAIVTSAARRGQMYGFAFDPVCMVDEGRTPLESIGAGRSGGEFLYLYTDHRFGSTGPLTAVSVFWGAALIRQKDLTIVDAWNALGLEIVPPDKVTRSGNEVSVKPDDYAQMAANGFVESFAENVLVPMQQRHFGDQIAREVAEIFEAANAESLTPTIAPTGGLPELAISYNQPGTCTIYFQKSEGEPFRRCKVEPAGKAYEFGKIAAGRWTVYAKIAADETSREPRYYRAAFAAKAAERYAVEVP